jgi:hypothetical protein
LVERLEQKIAQCNFDQPLNVNSPKQVSMAIFGTVQSTSKLELSKASQGEGVEYQRQQELAKLVLELRSLTSKVKQKSKVNGDARFIEEEQVDTNGKVADMVNKFTTNDEDNGKASETIATTATQQTSTSSHEQNVDSLFDAKSSKLDPYWKEALTQVTKPSAQNLVFQLNAQLCPTGFDPSASPHVRSTSTSTSEVRKKGTLLHFIRQQKLKYRDCIILTRVGEFYETYGMDAVLLVEVCDYVFTRLVTRRFTHTSHITEPQWHMSIALWTECNGWKGKGRVSCTKCTSDARLSHVTWLSSGCL